MSWENMNTRAEALRGLLDLVGLKRLWAEDGPTPDAEAVRRSGKLPEDAAVLLEIVYDLWDGTGRAPLTKVEKLDPLVLQAFGEMLDAIGSGTLADWCDGAIALKLRAMAWAARRGEIKDALGGVDEGAEDVLLQAAEIVEGMLEGVPMIARSA